MQGKEKPDEPATVDVSQWMGRDVSIGVVTLNYLRQSVIRYVSFSMQSEGEKASQGLKVTRRRGHVLRAHQANHSRATCNQTRDGSTDTVM